NRLLSRLSPVLAFADVVHLLPDKLAGRRGRTLTLFEVFLRVVQRLVFCHIPPRPPVRGTDSRQCEKNRATLCAPTRPVCMANAMRMEPAPRERLTWQQ